MAPSFKAVDKINEKLSRIGNLASDGRPILGLDAAELARIVFSIDENCIIIPGHIWTPWFSLFGSMSGFDRIEDCFEEQTPKIFALETGLSSDPAMNWRLSALDKFTLVSNSDSHSPQKIGREANVFNCSLDYKTIRDTLKNKDREKLLYTIEFFPEEGKYHFDGHRLCSIRWSPQETKEHNGRCPKCGKPVTMGVANRVAELADRPEKYRPDNAIPFKNLIPLDEIIADALGVSKTSMAVEKGYLSYIAYFGTEFNILLHADAQELAKGLPSRIADGVLRSRAGKVDIQAGFDGEYGKISIFRKEESAEKNEEQLKLF
ncbi:MAG: DNA helicase UvrD [Candidatus Omnitrophica bacterium]|nr:DNA helicase UvrD [Candidatus Omnitrophota bacterium]